MRQYLNDEHRAIFDRNFQKALNGGADARQAEAIAKERTLYVVMKSSAAIAHQRQLNAGTVTNYKLPWERD
jgi:hypothetical protein